MHTRRLTFAVGTGLLTASLSTGMVGCKKQPTANPGPQETPHVNEGPETEEPEEPTAEEPEGGTEIVNTVPSPE